MSLIERLLRKPAPAGASSAREVSEAGPPRRALADRSARDYRPDYCRILTREPDAAADTALIRRAWESLEHDMALVPEGEVLLAPTDPDAFMSLGADSLGDVVWTRAVYMDRYCVSNRDYAEFVEAGGYGQEALWPAEILPKVLQFVDSTGCSGPRYWANGQPAADKLDHPVVGVCWYEANAYAYWRGKRLPSPAEWQRAATWAAGQVGTLTNVRYPWGDSFDPSRCNTLNGGAGTTTAVQEYYGGSTPNGLFQLIGNVWEWTAALFECDISPNGDRVLFDQPFGEIRGGAFDTYFASQATSLFRTGQALLHRGDSLGFRCCVGVEQLVAPRDPYSFLEETSRS